MPRMKMLPSRQTRRGWLSIKTFLVGLMVGFFDEGVEILLDATFLRCEAQADHQVT